MITKEEFEEKIWYFYLDLEEEFIQIEKIIPYDSINENTFSYKYMGLLQSICSEIEFVFKKFIEFKDNTYDKKTIGDFEKFIEDYYPHIKNSKITCYKHRFRNKKLEPFKNWNSGSSPSWWQVYNKIKHDRVKIKDADNEWYLHANQKNVLTALGGLFVLTMYFHEEISQNLNSDDEIRVLLPLSDIFHLDDFGNYYERIVANRFYFELKDDGHLYLTTSDR